MSRFLTTGVIMTRWHSAWLRRTGTEREERFRGEQWRSHLFAHVQTDLEPVGSGRASDKGRARLQRTEEELTRMQADLDQGPVGQ